MWIESGTTNKLGMDAVREHLRENNIQYVIMNEGDDNEINVSLGSLDKMDLVTYKVENHRIYIYED